MRDLMLVELESPMGERTLDNGVVLFYPEGAHGSASEIHVWANVLKTGPGVWAKRRGTELGYRIPVDIHPGDRVMVVYYLSKVESQIAIQKLLGKNIIIIQPEDVLCVESAKQEDAG
jgi:hypothetical protein